MKYENEERLDLYQEMEHKNQEKSNLYQKML